MRIDDVVIAGGGIAGLALALGLKRAHPGVAVTLVDPAGLPEAGAARAHLRAIAVAAASRRLLEGLGVWHAVAPRAQPMHGMRITDSRAADALRPTFLDFGGAPALLRGEQPKPDEPFAHMVYQDDLRRALAAACAAAGVTVLARRIEGFRLDGETMRLEPASLGARARLLVAADGPNSRLRGQARIMTVGWDYGQSGVVATIGHDLSHDGVAIQHFLPGGPLAILPLRDEDGAPRRFSLVWTEASAEADRLASLPAEAFVAALESRIGFAYGPLRLLDRPRAHPLRLTLPRRLVAPRFALVGDAARAIHPLAGQGLNMGLRDVAALLETVAEALDLGLDPGAADLLRRYERARRFDSLLMAGATDGLNRLFSNDALPLRLLRDLGLGIVDRMPALKHMFIRDAAGLAGALPDRMRLGT